MRSAADNLVPVTLEIGGKCPVVVGKSADIRMVADRVMGTKTINSGQLCLTPDYIFLPEGKEEAFIEEAHKALVKCYESLAVVGNSGMGAGAHRHSQQPCIQPGSGQWYR